MASINGILNVAKPRGKTSFEVVSQVRRWSGERRVGHGGTLDPWATGVLPICMGWGTRVVEFLMDAGKSYRAEIELGVTTDTYDASGRTVERHSLPSMGAGEIEEALDSFRGDIEQIPPMYSAVKYNGKRLYQMARAGIEVERKARRVHIFDLRLVDWQSPLITIEVDCGKGTYIRALAHDLGQVLGCGAYLRDLVRLRCGAFDLKDGITFSQLEDAFHGDYWQDFLYPVDSVLLGWKAVIVKEGEEYLVRNGHSLPLGEYFDAHTPRDGDRCRAYTLDGLFLAVLRWEAGRKAWHPDKVFTSGDSRG